MMTATELNIELYNRFKSLKANVDDIAVISDGRDYRFKVLIEIDGDWKHDHIRATNYLVECIDDIFKGMIPVFYRSNMRNLDNDDDNNSDCYRAEYTYKLQFLER